MTRTVQIWKCVCGATRVYGNSPMPISGRRALLSCAKGCQREATLHRFVETTEHTPTWARPLSAAAVN